MAKAQDIKHNGQLFCGKQNLLLVASGVLHRVQKGHAMTLRLCS